MQYNQFFVYFFNVDYAFLGKHIALGDASVQRISVVILF